MQARRRRRAPAPERGPTARRSTRRGRKRSVRPPMQARARTGAVRARTIRRARVRATGPRDPPRSRHAAVEPMQQRDDDRDRKRPREEAAVRQQVIVRPADAADGEQRRLRASVGSSSSAGNRAIGHRNGRCADGERHGSECEQCHERGNLRRRAAANRSISRQPAPSHQSTPHASTTPENSRSDPGGPFASRCSCQAL